MYRMGKKKTTASKSKKVHEEVLDPMGPSLAKLTEVPASTPIEEQVEVQQCKDLEHKNKEKEIGNEVVVSPPKLVEHPENIKPRQLRLRKGKDQWYLQKETVET